MLIGKEFVNKKNLIIWTYEMDQQIKSYWNTLGQCEKSSLTKNLLLSKIPTGVWMLSDSESFTSSSRD